MKNLFKKYKIKLIIYYLNLKLLLINLNIKYLFNLYNCLYKNITFFNILIFNDITSFYDKFVYLKLKILLKENYETNLKQTNWNFLKLIFLLEALSSLLLFINWFYLFFTIIMEIFIKFNIFVNNPYFGFFILDLCKTLIFGYIFFFLPLDYKKIIFLFYFFYNLFLIINLIVQKKHKELYFMLMKLLFQKIKVLNNQFYINNKLIIFLNIIFKKKLNELITKKIAIEEKIKNLKKN